VLVFVDLCRGIESGWCRFGFDLCVLLWFVTGKKEDDENID
jgi:hypothetical protein